MWTSWSGIFEPRGRQDTIAKLEGLELIPRKIIEYRGTRLEETTQPRLIRGGVSKIDLENRSVWKADQKVDVLPEGVRHPGVSHAPPEHSHPARETASGFVAPNTGELEYLRTYVRHLRKKIDQDPARPEYVLTEPFGWGSLPGPRGFRRPPFCRNLTYRAPVFMSFLWIRRCESTNGPVLTAQLLSDYLPPK